LPARASAFSSFARSFIAARSSAVNPLDCVLFFSASAKHLLLLLSAASGCGSGYRG
jgi:hypothetical protein